jgi:hypothetical protein
VTLNTGLQDEIDVEERWNGIPGSLSELSDEKRTDRSHTVCGSRHLFLSR